MEMEVKEWHPSEKYSFFDKRFRYQILATLTMYILTCEHGIELGWLSPTLLKLQSEDSPVGFTVTVEQISWIGSLFGLGALTGNILFGILVDKMGRKFSMKILGIPHMLFWILVYFADNVVYLYVARFFSGITSSGIYIVIQVFVGEISHPSIRGALTSMGMFMLCFGILIGFVLATKLDYFLMPCIIIALPIIFTITGLFFPETPLYLFKNRKEEAAEKSYKFYNNFDKDTTKDAEDGNNKILLEYEDIKESILNSDQSDKSTFADFFNKPTMKIFLTVAVIIILNQFSGTLAFINYASVIFEESGSPMDPDTSTMIIGVTPLLGTCLGVLLVDRFGRKVLLLSSAMLMGSGMFAFGLYTHFATPELHERFVWIPLMLLSFSVICASYGVIALTFTIILEIMPAKIRAKGIALTLCFDSILVFIALKAFPYFIFDLGISITMYFCGSICFLCSIYHFIFLKETKGISLSNN